MRAPLLFFLLAAIIPAAASAQEEEFTMLHIIDHKYLPDPLEVPRGHTVVVMGFPDTNKTAEQTEPHTVTDIRCPLTGACETFDIRNIPPDASQHPFTAPMEPGTYPFFCRYHGDRQGSGMVGTLIVTEASSPSSGSPTPAAPPGGATPRDVVDADRDVPWPAFLTIAALGGGAALSRRR